MHEIGIAREIHRLCRRELEHVPAARLSSARVAIGELAAVEPELLRFAWEAVTAGGPDAGAKLEVRWCPCRQICNACGDVADRQRGDWLRTCPHCNGSLELEGGQELDLLQLSYDLPEDEDAADETRLEIAAHRESVP